MAGPRLHLLVGLKFFLGSCQGQSWTRNWTDLNQWVEGSSDSAMGKTGTNNAATKEEMMVKWIRDAFTQKYHKDEISTGRSIQAHCDNASLLLGVLRKSITWPQSPGSCGDLLHHVPAEEDARIFSGEQQVEGRKMKGLC